MTVLNNLGVTKILCRFNLLLEGKAGREIAESSRWEFSEKFSASNFTLSDAKDNTSGTLNGEGRADLPLLKFEFREIQRYVLLQQTYIEISWIYKIINVSTD